MSRGLKNNNPGNIRLSSTLWKGEKTPSGDKAFKQFSGMNYGYRALLKLLQNYNHLFGCKTLSPMIRRWAPETENDTNAYIQAVCRFTGMDPGQEVDVNDKETMCKLAAAISRVENGEPARMEDIKAGWEIL